LNPAGSLAELRARLDAADCEYELIHHPTPIVSTGDAAAYFDVAKAAPTLIVETDHGPTALILGAAGGRLDPDTARADLGFERLRLVARREAADATGYEAGAIPLVGHGLPTIIDRRLLTMDHLYGGSGDPLYTLKIAPGDLVRMNDVIGFLDRGL
jgi:prolyl-tRNA editing enzyme YbaK/EbsC (Cys-tRNA(Pro) deacylase)